jgi:hypothetical protein
MAKVLFDSFSGITPKVADRLLPPSGALIAQNCLLGEGNIVPIEEPSTIEACGASKQSLYLWRRGGTTEWLTFTSDTDVQKGCIADDQYARIYYTDGTTLHEKLWNGSAITITNVAFTPPPAAGTGGAYSYSGPIDPYKSRVTKTKMFNPSTIGCVWGPANQNITCTQSGYKWEDNVLTVTFRFPRTAVSSPIQDMYRFSIHPDEKFPSNTSHIPSSASDTQEAGFSQVIDLTYDGSSISGGTATDKWAKLKLVNVESGNTIYDDSSNAPGQYWLAHEVIAIFNIEASRPMKQFQCYVQTLVDEYGQESPPSDVSEEVEWDINDKLTVKTYSGAGPSGSAAVKARLYRSAVGSDQTNFYFLAEVTPGQSYIDFKRDADLDELMPLIENPPSVMYGLVSMAGGFFAAFNGKELYFSEPYMPYSWPIKYRLTLDYDIVGLCSKENDLLVTTKGTPYYGSGSHPEILTITKMPINQACVSKRGMAYVDAMALYPSPDGIVMVSGGSANLVTNQMYTREQWQALTPSGMAAAGHDGKYIAFHATGGILLDLTGENGILTTTDQTALGVHQDLENDELYLIQTTNVMKWRGGTNKLQVTWKSKEYQFQQPVSWSAAKIVAAAYVGSGLQEMHLRFYSEGTLVLDYTVTSQKAFRLPKVRWEKLWSFEITGYDAVHRLCIGTSMEECRTA